jgi:protein-S-isoprenylcysteine O-methyltransferase Ste14
MPGSGAERLFNLAVWVCWGVFGAVWLVGALYNARRAPEVRTRSGSARSWVVLWAAAVWLVWRLVPARDWRPLTVQGSGVREIGLVVLVAATAFTLWARGVLGTMWSSAPQARKGHRLRTEGPYAVTRHPIYTGILGMIVGTALMSGLGHFIIVVVVIVVGLEVRIRQEEHLMTEAFPEDYPEYRRRVPQLVPGWYSIRALGHR